MRGSGSKARQIALPFEWDEGNGGDIVLTPAFERSLQPLRHLEYWQATGAILIGPERSGKTAIGKWVEAETGALVIDDAHDMQDEELFHGWNRAKESNRACLMLAVSPPGEWNIDLPDLKSRVASALMVSLPVADEEMMRALIVHHLARHGATIGEDALGYAIRRIEHSHVAAERFARQINLLSLAEKKPITLPLVRTLYDMLDSGRAPDLFADI